MSKKQKSTRFEKHIYIENRSGALRFKVVVSSSLQDSSTFSTVEEGALWARRRRVELLEDKAALAKRQGLPNVSYVKQALDSVQLPLRQQVSIKLTDVFDSFESFELPKLSSQTTEASRLARLRKWFGALTTEQLNEGLIGKWILDRLSGKLGSGRDPNRAATMSGDRGEEPLTKHQRYTRKKAGKEVPEKPIFPVSTQSVRHELKLLRRAVTKYLQKENRWPVYGAWWQAHYLMMMELPEPADPRRRRVSDNELVAIFNGIADRCLKAAILFAVLTSLRRSEIVSLRWEDVDFTRKVVLLRKPGFVKKTKVHEREVPLLPGAIKVLQDLKPQKRGLIFPVPAVDLSHAWRDAADEAEIYDARLHDCRREAISRLVETCRLTVHEVVLFSGHSDIRTLEKHYLRLDPALMASRLGELPAAIDLAPSL
jgi:integrase